MSIDICRSRKVPDITSTSISDAWLSAVALTSSAPHGEVLNLNVTVTGLAEGGPQEDAAVRSALDQTLAESGMGSVQTVASTIFPSSLWNPSRPKEQLFARYMAAFPKIRKCRSNNRGTYFQRLINYPSFKAQGFNQLKHVIETYLGGNHRRSALQASIIVPETDLNNAPLQGFPCMQQVAFVPTAKTSTLHVVGFYPHQYLFQRAYGNYLGLILLGRFVAHEMHLTLANMTCVSTIAHLEVSANKIEPILSVKP
jgi:thymidylate synthase